MWMNKVKMIFLTSESKNGHTQQKPSAENNNENACKSIKYILKIPIGSCDHLNLYEVKDKQTEMERSFKTAFEQMKKRF